MDEHVLIQMNVWLIMVDATGSMLLAPTLMDQGRVHVTLVLLAMAHFATTSMNVFQTMVAAMPTPTAQTLWDHVSVNVIQDTVEMDWFAWIQMNAPRREEDAMPMPGIHSSSWCCITDHCSCNGLLHVHVPCFPIETCYNAIGHPIDRPTDKALNFVFIVH